MDVGHDLVGKLDGQTVILYTYRHKHWTTGKRAYLAEDEVHCQWRPDGLRRGEDLLADVELPGHPGERERGAHMHCTL